MQKQDVRKSSALVRKVAFHAQPEAAAQLAYHKDALEALLAPVNADASKIIAGYWPIRTEIDPRPLMDVFAQAGASLCLPATPEPGLPLSFHSWSGDEGSLVEGPYNTRQPDPDMPIVLPDLVLAPLLAFDDKCWRLGYGGGFYDRTLAALESAGHKARIVGLAFVEQQIDQVPTGLYDRQLDGILTPNGLMLAQTT